MKLVKFGNDTVLCGVSGVSVGLGVSLEIADDCKSGGKDIIAGDQRNHLRWKKHDLLL